MSLLSINQILTIKKYVYQNARLLERQLFELFFGNGTEQACIQALKAYQNDDGGFGNGIEPDILCPTSTAIGAETALFVLELLDAEDAYDLDPLLQWIAENQNMAGYIPHPPEVMFDFPHQPWWKNPDNERILALAGYLRKLGMTDSSFFGKVHHYFEQLETPSTETYYSYPYFIYLKHCGETTEDKKQLEKMTVQLPLLLDKHADHFPLFSRAWYHAVDLLDHETVTSEAQKFANAMTEEGSLDAPYPELPWWRPIWTVDGLILLKRFRFL